MKLIECINEKIMEKNLVCKVTSANNIVVLKNSKPVLLFAVENSLDEGKFNFHETKSLEFKKVYPKLIYGILTQSKLNYHLLKKAKNIDKFLFIPSEKNRKEVCEMIREEIKSIN